MGVEYTIFCNGCSAVIDASRLSAADARKAVRELGGKVNLPGGRDLCQHCASDGIKPE